MGTRAHLVFGNLIGLAVIVSGCSSIVDLSRYSEAVPDAPSASATTTSDYVGLRFAMIGMKPHIGQHLEYYIVDSHNFIQSRGIVDAMPVGDITLNAPLSIPKSNGPYHFDFYADVNKSGGFDGLGSVLTNDHAWRIEPLADYPDGISPVDGVIQVRFTHNTSFTDIRDYPSGTPNAAQDTALDAVIRVHDFDALQGKDTEIRVRERISRHTVGLFRSPAIRGPVLEAKISGSVESGADYDVEVYVDQNANGTYDDPAQGGGDLGWRFGGTSDDTGLNVTIDLGASMAQANIDVGAP